MTETELEVREKIERLGESLEHVPGAHWGILHALNDLIDQVTRLLAEREIEYRSALRKPVN